MRGHLTRIASMELDKLALYRAGAQVTADDVRALVAEAVPGSIWAFTDAIGVNGDRLCLKDAGCRRHEFPIKRSHSRSMIPSQNPRGSTR